MVSFWIQVTEFLLGFRYQHVAHESRTGRLRGGTAAIGAPLAALGLQSEGGLVEPAPRHRKVRQENQNSVK